MTDTKTIFSIHDEPEIEEGNDIMEYVTDQDDYLDAEFIKTMAELIFVRNNNDSF